MDAMTEYYQAKEREESAVIRINDSCLELLDSLEELERENAKLRSELESVGTAAYLYGRTDLAAENAKLRELVALWSVINKHMSLCATIDCEKCPVREECRESVYLEGLLGIDSKELSWRVQERMSELGIEVDG